MGVALINLDRPNEAINYLEICLKINPNNVNALKIMEIALKNTGQFKKAKNYWNRALNVDPKNLRYKKFKLNYILALFFSKSSYKIVKSNDTKLFCISTSSKKIIFS